MSLVTPRLLWASYNNVYRLLYFLLSTFVLPALLVTPPSLSSTTTTTATHESCASAADQKESSKAAEPIHLRIPDMLGACKYPLRLNPHHEQVGIASESWLFRGGNLSEKRRKAYRGIKVGLITGMCYPDAPQARLRIISDYINYLFHLDNISDEMDSKGTARTGDVVMGILNDPSGFQTSDTHLARMTRDFWKRLVKTSTVATQQRFIRSMDLFFDAVGVEAVHRRGGNKYELEEYIELRRDTSGCKPCFALIEYGCGLDLPDFVMEHEVIQSLNDGASDVISWSNDIYSFNVEQSKGDTHNMVVIIMEEQGVDMQAAIDTVGALVTETLDRFEEDKRRLPSWGADVDSQVALYIQGLEDWMIGNFEWSFASERYFGKLGPEVKRTGTVPLLPRRA